TARLHARGLLKDCFRRLAKWTVFHALGSDAALGLKLSRIAAAGALTILNMHRGSDEATSAYKPLKPALFDALFCWLKARFQIVTWGEFKELGWTGKPPLIFSFDDGYKDFIEIAVPILAKHGLKANQNVIPLSVDSGRPPMNVILQDFIGSAPAALLREMEFPGVPHSADLNDRVRFGNLASAGLKYRPILEQKALFAHLEPQLARFDGFRMTAMMTIDDVRQLAGEHEIGAHSFEHATMAVEGDAYLSDDVAQCRAWCHDRIGAAPRVYAFPNGSAGVGQAEIVRQAGFEHVLLVGERFSDSTRWLHPRFNLHAANIAE